MYIALGLLLVGIAFIGIFVPGIPRTGPAIGATICFSKASPRLYNWMRASKHFGPYLRNYFEKTGLPMAYKVRTIALMWSAMTLSVSVVDILFVRILVPCIGVAVSFHVFGAKNDLTPAEPYPPGYNIRTIGMTWIFLALAIALSAPALTYPLIALAVFGFTLPLAVFAIRTR